MSKERDWYNFNCERKLLTGNLKLKKGINSITLELKAPVDTFETVIYTLELIPESKKTAVLKDIRKREQPVLKWIGFPP